MKSQALFVSSLNFGHGGGFTLGFVERKCLTLPLRCEIIGGALARSSLVRSQARLSVSNKLLTLHVRATMRSRCVAP